MLKKRNVSERLKTVEPVLAPRARRLPKRLALFVVVEDTSDSMHAAHVAVGQFWPGLSSWFVEQFGERIANLVYVAKVLISGMIVSSDFAPLSTATDPKIEPSGTTPLGQGLREAATKIEKFVEEAIDAEASVQGVHVMLLTDMHAYGESAEQTGSGVAYFVDVMNRLQGQVWIVGPDKESMNADLVQKLDLQGRGVKYFGDDPASVRDFSFESLLSASKVLGGRAEPREPRRKG